MDNLDTTLENAISYLQDLIQNNKSMNLNKGQILYLRPALSLIRNIIPIEGVLVFVDDLIEVLEVEDNCCSIKEMGMC